MEDKIKQFLLIVYVIISTLVVASLLSDPVSSQYAPSSGQLLGKISAANFNTTTDQIIQINNARTYIVRKIIIHNASTSLTLSVGGVYRSASKTNPIVAASQVYSGLTSSTKFLDLTLASILTTDVRTERTLYFALTTAQGTAATADILVFGDILN